MLRAPFFNTLHYSLLLTIEDAFGLCCLQHSCDATVQPMAPLFAHP